MQPRRSNHEIETNRCKALYLKELSHLRKKRGNKFIDCHSLISDLVGNPLNWPEKICSFQKNTRVGKDRDFRRILVSDHLKFAQRHKLTLFLVGNGVPPGVVREYYRSAGSLRDASAIRHVENTLRMFEKPALNRKEIDNFWCFDLVREKWERLGDY